MNFFIIVVIIFVVTANTCTSSSKRLNYKSNDFDRISAEVTDKNQQPKKISSDLISKEAVSNTEKETISIDVEQKESVSKETISVDPKVATKIQTVESVLSVFKQNPTDSNLQKQIQDSIDSLRVTLSEVYDNLGDAVEKELEDKYTNIFTLLDDLDEVRDSIAEGKQESCSIYTRFKTEEELIDSLKKSIINVMSYRSTL